MTAGRASLSVPWADKRTPVRTTAAWFRTAAGSVPPSGLVLLGIASLQLGAALAKEVFAALPPTAVVTLRLVFAALVLLPVLRPKLAGHSRGDFGLAALFGVSVAGMNLAFYESLSRIPLGVAVTIEFLGPLAIAILGSRRRLDLLWVVLAGTGVALLSGGGAEAIDPVGIGFALLAAVGWAAYILLNAAVGRRFPGASGLALAMTVGAVTAAPVGFTSGADYTNVPALLTCAGVALLSSVIPYSLEMEALRRMPAGVFGLLMSLEPAVAALIGLVVLGEILGLREWTAIMCVVIACIGATRRPSERQPPPAME